MWEAAILWTCRDSPPVRVLGITFFPNVTSQSSNPSAAASFKVCIRRYMPYIHETDSPHPCNAMWKEWNHGLTKTDCHPLDHTFSFPKSSRFSTLFHTPIKMPLSDNFSNKQRRPDEIYPRKIKGSNLDLYYELYDQYRLILLRSG